MPPVALDRLFSVRARHGIDGAGFVRFRDSRLYGERGLAGAEEAVWALGETLTIEYATDALAQCTTTYEPDENHIR